MIDSARVVKVVLWGVKRREGGSKGPVIGNGGLGVIR